MSICSSPRGAIRTKQKSESATIELGIETDVAISRKSSFLRFIARQLSATGRGGGGEGRRGREGQRGVHANAVNVAPLRPRLTAPIALIARAVRRNVRTAYGGGRMVARGNGQPSERTYASLFRAF